MTQKVMIVLTTDVYAGKTYRKGEVLSGILKNNGDVTIKKSKYYITFDKEWFNIVEHLS